MDSSLVASLLCSSYTWVFLVLPDEVNFRPSNFSHTKVGKKEEKHFSISCMQSKDQPQNGLGDRISTERKRREKIFNESHAIFYAFQKLFSSFLSCSSFQNFSFTTHFVQKIQQTLRILKGFVLTQIKPNLTLPWSAKFLHKACRVQCKRYIYKLQQLFFSNMLRSQSFPSFLLGNYVVCVKEMQITKSFYSHLFIRASSQAKI